MSEEKKIIYCTNCGSGNNSTAKFCSNCGTKLEQPAGQAGGGTSQSEGAFSSEESKPLYERITDAEEERPASPYQEEIQINYGSSQQDFGSFGSSTGSGTYYDTQGTQYYSADFDEEKPGGGNIGFAIASLICGIISLVCCCLGLFSGVLAIAAIVLGVITLCFKYDGKGMAIAGIATGGVALALIIVSMVISTTSFYREWVDEFLYDLYYLK